MEEETRRVEPTGYEESRARLLTEGVKGLLLINGGGAVALLAFLQSVWGKDPALAGLILQGLGWMAFGLMLAACVPFLRFVQSHLHDPNRKEQGYGGSRRSFMPLFRDACLASSLMAFVFAALLLVVQGSNLTMEPSLAPGSEHIKYAPAGNGEGPIRLPEARATGDRASTEAAGSANIGRWVLIVAGIGIAAVGALAALGYTRSTGAVLVTVGASISLSGALIKEVKIDSVFKIDKATLLEVALQNAGSASPQQLGTIKAFKSGSAQEIEGAKGEAVYEHIAGHWVKNRRAGRDGMLLVIGSTDRVPLNESGRSRYETNVGLARARAETVKKRLVQTVMRHAPELPLLPEQVIALVTGPQTTGEEESTPLSGFPSDRRVDVWAFWAPARKPQPH